MTRYRPDLALIALCLCACGEDSLGETFQPTDPGENTSQNPSPLNTGDYGYFVSGTFTPEVGAAAGAASDPSQTASANLCVRIDQVRDNEPQNQASTLSGSLRLTGGSDDGFTYQDTVNPTIDPATIQSALSPLWLETVVFPDGQPVTPEVARSFVLEQGPRPDDDATSFLFIEVRSRDGWAGFSDVTADTFTWFTGPPLSFDNDLLFDNAFFDSRPPPPSTTNTFTLTWRETGDTTYPTELQGAVAHSIRFEYDAAGVLENVRELIVPDVNPGADLNASAPTLICIDGQACLQGFLQNDDFDRLFCGF